MFKVYLSEPYPSLGTFRNQVTDILAWTLCRQSFPTVLETLPFLPLRINQQMYLTQKHGSCFPLACFPFQRKCFQEKAGCYGSFTVNHFSIRRLENINHFESPDLLNTPKFIIIRMKKRRDPQGDFQK